MFLNQFGYATKILVVCSEFNELKLEWSNSLTL